MKQAILLTSASVLFATNLMANAANLPAVESAPAPTSCVGCGCPDGRTNFPSGIYGGLQAGYDHMMTRYRGVYRDNTLNLGNVFNSKVSDSSGGFVGEAFIGGRFVYKNCVVAGLETAFLFSTAKNSRTAIFDPQNPALRLSYKTKRDFAVIPSGVLGMLLNNRMMVYGKAGLAISNFSNELFDGLANVPRRTKAKKTLLGFAPAIGLEYGFSSRLSIRGEIGAELYGKRGRSYLIADVQPVNNAPAQDTLSLVSHTNMLNAKVGLVIKL